MRLLRIGLLLLVGLVVHTEALEKRSLVPQASITKGSETLIEGSGDPKKLSEGPDQEITIQGSGNGANIDDEDDYRGSGKPDTVDEGSGSPQVWEPVPVITTTSTTTQSPLIEEPSDKEFKVSVEEEHSMQTPRTEVRQEVFVNLRTTTPSLMDPQPPPLPPITQSPTTTTSSTISTTRRPSIPAAIPRDEDEPTPFHHMLKPGVFAAIVGGSIVGLLATVFIIVFIVYRMRKKDEGSYALDEPKARPYAGYAYTKASTKEFYA